MYRSIFNKVKSIVPRISDTELIALRTGNTHLDAQIFNGSVSLPSVIKREEFKFSPNKVDNLLENFGNIKVFPSTKLPNILSQLSRDKFFSFLIDEKYQ